MFRVKFFSTLLAVFVLTMGTARAEVAQAYRGPRLFLGGFCSGYVYNGRWGFYYGNLTPQMACQTVANSLLATTGQGLSAVNGGYYNQNGMNQVVVDCWGRRAVYTGFGANPLNQAYQVAYASGLGYCLFGVTY